MRARTETRLARRAVSTNVDAVRDETTRDDTGTFSARGQDNEAGLGLLIAWSRDEPERVGEVVLVPARDERAHVIGRGDSAPEKPRHVRAAWLRQRPNDSRATPPLADSRLSRDHLRVERVDGRTLAIENLGRRALRVRDRETRHVVARPGEVIVVEGLLVLLCVARPSVLPPTLHIDAAELPPFGSGDRMGLVGESPAAWALRDAVAFAARATGHVLVHGPIGSGKHVVARGLGAGAVELDVATTPPSELRQAAQALLDGGSTLALAGLEHVGLVGADHVARLLTELGARGVRVIATTTAPPEALEVAARSRFSHVIAVPSLASRPEDVPLVLRAIAQRALSPQSDHGRRFLGADGAPRIGPGLVEALLLAPPDGGAHGLEATLWQALRASSGEWIEVPAEVLRAAQSVAVREPVALDPEPADFDGGDDDDDDGGPIEPVEAIAASDLPPSVMSGLANLTRAERVVLQHVALSRTSRQIARALFVSVRTVQNHRAHICDKLGLRGHNRLLAVAMALRPVLGAPQSG